MFKYLFELTDATSMDVVGVDSGWSGCEAGWVERDRGSELAGSNLLERGWDDEVVVLDGRQEYRDLHGNLVGDGVRRARGHLAALVVLVHDQVATRGQLRVLGAPGTQTQPY